MKNDILKEIKNRRKFFRVLRKFNFSTEDSGPEEALHFWPTDELIKASQFLAREYFFVEVCLDNRPFLYKFVHGGHHEGGNHTNSFWSHEALFEYIALIFIKKGFIVPGKEIPFSLEYLHSIGMDKDKFSKYFFNMLMFN